MHKALQGPEQLSQVLIGMKITHTLKDKRTNTMLPTLTMACFDLSLFRPEWPEPLGRDERGVFFIKSGYSGILKSTLLNEITGRIEL